MATSSSAAGSLQPDPSTDLSPGDEAAAGTPGAAENVCPECGGSGKLDNASCPECDGTGKVITGIGGG